VQEDVGESEEDGGEGGRLGGVLEDVQEYVGEG
jgi:hypothetical protein